jgi:hypothetical protein
MMNTRLLSLLFILLFSQDIKAKTAEFETATEAVKNMKVGYFYVGSTISWLEEEQGVDQIPQYWKEYAGKSFEDVYGYPALHPQWMKMLRKAGINSVRLPIHWWMHLETDGTIDPVWMRHIRGIVDIILDEGMYCIVNNGYDDWTIASTKEYERRKDLFEYLWRQIAMEFKDYDHHLLFEGYNEMRDEYGSWNWPSSACPGYFDENVSRDAYQALYNYEKSFVDAVRSTGGNNTTRNLIVNTYACSPGDGDYNSHVTDALINFKLPEDIYDGHLIIGVHTYYDTASLQTAKDDVDDIMNKLRKHLVPLGAPIIISEWNADAGQDLYYKYPENTLALARYFMEKVRENGFANICLTSIFSNEQYRLLPAFDIPEYIDAMMKGYYGDEYNHKFLTIDDYDIQYANVTYNTLYGSLLLCEKSLNLSEYKGIKVEVENIEDCCIVLFGEIDEKIHWCGFTSPTEIFLFDHSILGEKVTKIELKNTRDGINKNKVYNIHLIKQDGTEEKIDIGTVRKGWAGACVCEYSGKRKQFIHNVDYDYPWAELNIFYDDVPLKIKDYKGIRLELAEPLANLNIKIYGDGEQKEDYLGMNSTSTTIIFNTDIFSNEINRVTLQNNTDCKAQAKVISAWLIRQDGTEEYSDLSPFWGCTITNTEPYTTFINNVSIGNLHTDSRIYNLAGQRLSKPQKGINIIDGKKVVIK